MRVYSAFSKKCFTNVQDKQMGSSMNAGRIRSELSSASTRKSSPLQTAAFDSQLHFFVSLKFGSPVQYHNSFMEIHLFSSCIWIIKVACGSSHPIGVLFLFFVDFWGWWWLYNNFCELLFLLG